MIPGEEHINGIWIKVSERRVMLDIWLCKQATSLIMDGIEKYFMKEYGTKDPPFLDWSRKKIDAWSPK